LSFDGDLGGAAVGMNASDLTGCFSLSNSLTIVREEIGVDCGETCPVVPGVITGGPFEFCANDGQSDNVTNIGLSGNTGENSQWVVTDSDGGILGLPGNPSDIEFDNAGPGTCFIYHLSFDGEVTGLSLGQNIEAISGCSALSNAITVVRNVGDNCQTGMAVIVINEIIPGNRVELKNIGNASMDISNLWLCDFPAYDRIGNLTVSCGDFNVAPNETVTVQTSDISISENDGEMGLYLNSSFGNVNSIIDYVEWGSTGHGRSNVAASAGIWTSDDFVQAFSSGKSLSYDGDGDLSSDWNETDETPCNENNFGSTPINQSISLDVIGNPVDQNVHLKLSTNRPIGEITIEFRDLSGSLVKSEKVRTDLNEMQERLDISELSNGLYFISIKENFFFNVQKIVKQGF